MSLEKKFWTLKSEKENQQTLLTDNIRSIQNEVLTKKREMDHLKLNMANDQELEIRNLKFKNELEIKFAQQMEAKDAHLEELNNHINGLEKQLHLGKYALEAQKNDHFKGYQALKETHKMKVDSLTKEMGLLRNQINFDSNKDDLRNLKLQNELLTNKVEKSEKLIKEMAEKNEKLVSQKALSSVESVKEIERMRKELNGAKLERDKLELRNDSLSKENDELQIEFKKGENKVFDLQQQKKSLNDLLEKQKHLSDDLEDQISQQRQLAQKMFMEKSKDSSKRDTQLQSQILELKSEIRSLNSEKQKLSRLHSERLLGVKNSQTNVEMKNEGLRQELVRLNELISEHDDRKLSQNAKISKLQRELELLAEQFETLSLKKGRTDRELEDYKQLEEKGLVISEKQKENLTINEKMLQDLKKAKIGNLKIKKAYANMNKKLVEAVSEKVITQAKLKLLSKKMAGIGGGMGLTVDQKFGHVHHQTEIKRFDLTRVNNGSTTGIQNTGQGMSNLDPRIALQNHMGSQSSNIRVKQNINIIDNRENDEIQQICDPFPEPNVTGGNYSAQISKQQHEALLGNPFNETQNTLSAVSGITSAKFGGGGPQTTFNATNGSNISFQNTNTFQKPGEDKNSALAQVNSLIKTHTYHVDNEHPFARGVDETDSTYHMIDVRTDDGNISTVSRSRHQGGSLSPDGRIRLGNMRNVSPTANIHSEYGSFIRRPHPLHKTGEYLAQKHLITEANNLRNSLLDHPGLNSDMNPLALGNNFTAGNREGLEKGAVNMPKFVSVQFLKMLLTVIRIP